MQNNETSWAVYKASALETVTNDEKSKMHPYITVRK